MIELTVKTLDSQNHAFSVEEDITVASFKDKIAERIEIPADTQRIIYCGRVLKDDMKLKDYDVHGKVVHLVQRAPPGPNQNGARAASPQPQRRNVRGFDAGNAMYLRSVPFPTNLMESQGIVPPPPTHSLAGSRLNVAKRMLRRAEAVLNLLENPQARATEANPPEEPQDEVTPLFEARVIVPTNQINEPIDEALVLSAVQDTLLNAGTLSSNGAENNGNETTDLPQNPENNASQSQSLDSTPDNTSPMTASTENLASETRNGQTASGTNALLENASPTSEMADLLDTLSRLHTRFAPFLEQYEHFMRRDPTSQAEDVRKTQLMINRVSEIFHFLGHAYHSLSDIIVRVRTPPPRPLLCRPILIQHSAVLQTGIPIQVEAQINLNPDSNSSTTTNQTTTTSVTTAAGNTATTTTTSSENTNAGAAPTITAHIPPQMLGFPLFSGAGVHVQSFPVEIRGIPRLNASAQQNNASNGSARTAFTGANTTGTSTTQPSTTTTTTTTNGASNTTNSFNNSNVEFFMEVTPESITIDSLETTLLGAPPSADMLRGPPPEFLQSIMQLAGQIISRGGQNLNVTPANATGTNATASPTETTTQQNMSSTNHTTGQNSQARGNTQTNPTTSTQTRSTARPHVQLSSHAMQGFDPFLPCNSHHVTPRRRVPQQSTRTTVPNNNASSNSTQQSNANNATNQPNNPIYNIVQGILNSIQSAYRQRNPHQQQSSAPTQAQAPPTSNADVGASGERRTPSAGIIPSFLPFLQMMNLSDNNAPLPTIAQHLMQFSDEPHVEGESIITDLITFLTRNLTVADILDLNNGVLEPLMNIRTQLRSFILIRVLDGRVNEMNYERAVNNIVTELQPFLEHLNRLTVRDDIDIVRSAQMVLRSRLPNILALATSRNATALRSLVNQCRITSRQFFALILHSSANGIQGVEDVLEHIISHYMQGLPADIQQWTTMTSRVHLRQFISNLSVPPSILQPYIVRTVDAVTSPVHATATENGTTNNQEPMELDEQEPSGSSNEIVSPQLNLDNDSEPLPTVVFGTETWHNQIPADWVPIITRDSLRQRRQNQQQPFSDAYLSGMPSKRRKIVTSAKPQGSLPQVISESVRRAVTATGLTTVASLETVTEAASADMNIQSAYRDLLRTSVQANLEGNEDFTAERFPNASNYFNKP